MDPGIPNTTLGYVAQPAAAAHETQPAIAWDAVIAGAAAALALSITLTALAAGFGMKIAPSLASKDMLDAFTPILGSIMVLTQVLSAGLGGYLAGRLRVRWLNVHAHEVHFRDTAHGLLVWAIATVTGVVLAVFMAGSGPEDAASAAPSAILGAQTAAQAAAGQASGLDPATLQAAAERAAHIAAQAAFFLGVGMLLSAFIAAVAAAIGGMRRDEMYGR